MQHLFPNIVLLSNITREYYIDFFYPGKTSLFYHCPGYRLRPTGIFSCSLTDLSSLHSEEEVKVKLSKSGLCRIVTIMWLILLSNISIWLIFLKVMKCIYSCSLENMKIIWNRRDQFKLNNMGFFVYNIRMRLAWAYIPYLISLILFPKGN